MSVKDTILTNLQTALGQISVANGYSMDVGLVTREAVALTDLRGTNLPAIKISATTDETTETPVGSYQRATWPVPIVGVVEGPDLGAKAANFQADIRKCIFAADLGNNVICVRLAGSPAQESDDKVIFVDILQILYYYPESAP